MSTVRYYSSGIYPFCEVYRTYDVRYIQSCARFVRCNIRTMFLASCPQLRRSWGSCTRVVYHYCGKYNSPVYHTLAVEFLLCTHTLYCLFHHFFIVFNWFMLVNCVFFCAFNLSVYAICLARKSMRFFIGVSIEDRKFLWWALGWCFVQLSPKLNVPGFQ